jgi:enamine deaminase RidA (YjgF/YER057c/UK114 family)
VPYDRAIVAPAWGRVNLSEGIACGNVLFLSGRAAVDLNMLQAVSDDFGEQARHVLDQCVAVLGHAGSAPSTCCPSSAIC